MAAGAVRTSCEVAERLKAQGNDAFRRKKFKAAAALYTEAITLEPSQPSYYTNRALAHKMMQEPERVLADIDTALALPGISTALRAKSLGHRGWALQELGRHQDAVEALRQAISIAESATRDKEAVRRYEEALDLAMLRAFEEAEERLEVGNAQLLSLVEAVAAAATGTADAPGATQALAAELHPEAVADSRRHLHRLVAASAASSAAAHLQLPEARAAAGEDRSVPACFLCGISYELMRDPVVTPSGNSYERRHIEAYLRVKAQDPMTRKAMAVTDLRSNLALRGAIDYFVRANPWALRERMSVAR